MRRTSFSAWLLVAAVAGILVASRFGRALGPAGVILTIVLVVVGVLLVRDLIGTALTRQGPADRPPAPPRNVTPHEPALTPGAGATAPPPTRAPSVIVIEPPDETEQLAAKLRALDDLRAGGLVSDDEYEAKRARLIADF